jgi:hypothetical protein
MASVIDNISAEGVAELPKRLVSEVVRHRRG